jgi:hypothetical protein
MDLQIKKEKLTYRFVRNFVKNCEAETDGCGLSKYYSTLDEACARGIGPSLPTLP